MNADISYWLAEVQSLQQQLSAMRQERDEAHQDANNWRQRYETEAHQRRTETQGLRSEVQHLRATIAQLQNLTPLPTIDRSVDEIPETLIPAGASTADLQEHIRSLWLECDRYQKALQQERRTHEETRQSLTLALGDAVDKLTRLRTVQESGD